MYKEVNRAKAVSAQHWFRPESASPCRIPPVHLTSTPSEADSHSSQQQLEHQQQAPPPRKMVAAQDILFGLTNAAAAALCIAGGIANVILFKLSYRPLFICISSVLSGVLLVLLEVAPLSQWTTTHLGFLNSFTGRGIAYIFLSCSQIDTPLVQHDAWLYANAAGLSAAGILYIGLGLVDAFGGEDCSIPKPRSMQAVSRRYTPASRRGAGRDLEAAVPMRERKKIPSYVSTSAGSRFQEAGLVSHDLHAHSQRGISSRPGTANSRMSEFARSFWPRPSSAQGVERGHEPSDTVSTSATPVPQQQFDSQYRQDTVVVQTGTEGDLPELHFRALTFDDVQSKLPSAGPSREPSRSPLRLGIPAPAGPRRPKTATSATSGPVAGSSNSWRNSMPSGLASAQRSARQHRTISVAGVGDIELSSESESEDEIDEAQLLDSPRSVYGDKYEEAALKRKDTLKQKRLAKIERGVERTLSLRADKEKRTQALKEQSGLQ